MKAKITKRLVDEILKAGKEALVWDADVPGFGVKVTKTGKAHYCRSENHQPGTFPAYPQ